MDFPVQDKVREIHRRVEQQSKESRNTRTVLTERVFDELNALRGSYGRLYQIRNAVGQMPPSPATLRAKIGAYLIRVVQRMLFWYTPQITSFHNEASLALDQAGNLFELQMQQMEALGQEVQKLRGELMVLESELGRPRGETGGTEISRVAPLNGSGALPASFQFGLLDRLRGSEAETADKLRTYLRKIRSVDMPQGLWLDIGCGRGEWLELVRTAGYAARGVDSCPVAIHYCRRKDLDVVERDAIDYLQGVANESVALITVFHVIEHCSIERLLVLIREAARTLASGGLLICETPDPANLLVGCHYFWRDPTHQRPVPMELLEYVFQRLGLSVIERLHLNPPPENERLPFAEIEFIRHLNDHFYGTQDYALIGRR